MFPGWAAGLRRVEDILLNAFSDFGSGQYQGAVQHFTAAIDEIEILDPSQLHVMYTGRYRKFANGFNRQISECSLVSRSAAYAALKLYNLALKDATSALHYRPDYVKVSTRRECVLEGSQAYRCIECSRQLFTAVSPWWE